VGAGWTKADLARWLTGPYARATRHGARGERVAAAPPAGIPPASLEALLLEVRGQLLASLERAALVIGELDFTDAIVARGLVRRVRDASGCDAWVPVDGARIRLRERVESLLVADRLDGPSSYAELFVCRACDAVVFDPYAKPFGVCGAHRTSGMASAEPVEGAAGELADELGRRPA
jgi:hypothetical protein